MENSIEVQIILFFVLLLFWFLFSHVVHILFILFNDSGRVQIIVITITVKDTEYIIVQNMIQIIKILVFLFKMNCIREW